MAASFFFQWRLDEFESGGDTSGAKRRNFFLVVPLHFFGSKSTISRFGERFREGQYTVWSVSCLLYF